MFVRVLVSLALFGLVLGGLSYDALGQGKDKGSQTGKASPTAKAAQTAKKFEVPKDAVAGKVKSVDLKASTFTITLMDKKDRTFKVDDKTEFWGPKGGDRGTGPKGLSDDCMTMGYEIKVAAAKDVKVAKDVFLPNRKAETKKDTKK